VVGQGAGAELVKHEGPAESTPLLRWRGWVWVFLLLLIGAPLTLATHMGSGAELVRLRNALLVDADLEPDFDWSPPAMPHGFMQESGPRDPVFVAVARRLELDKKADDWERALTISKHLLGSGPRDEGALKQDLLGTYLGITEQRAGYCADFVRVFTAIAVAAEMPVRYWAFSFDGFGGHGHVFPEIWNRQRGRWQLLDVFDNYYFVDGSDEPLSAIQFHQALEKRSPTLKLHPLVESGRLGYEIEAKAWEYFQRGVPEWYLWWGNNVFTYDHAVLVRTLAPISRALEQFGGIVQGVHPHIRVLPSPANEAQRRDIRGLRRHVEWVGASMLIGATGLFLLGLRRRRDRRQRLRAIPI
jgi:hypothetical protein